MHGPPLQAGFAISGLCLSSQSVDPTRQRESLPWPHKGNNATRAALPSAVHFGATDCECPVFSGLRAARVAPALPVIGKSLDRQADRHTIHRCQRDLSFLQESLKMHPPTSIRSANSAASAVHQRDEEIERPAGFTQLRHGANLAWPRCTRYCRNSRSVTTVSGSPPSSTLSWRSARCISSGM